MLLTDQHHIITEVNDHLLQLAEMERKDVIGKTALELGILNEEFVKILWEEVAENGKLLNRELAFKTKSNKPVHGLFSTEKIELNKTGYWLTTIIDISERKKAEQKLSEVHERVSDSELRFRTLTKTAPVGIFETDATGSTTYVNETWLQYSGMKFEEAMGDGWLNAVHAEDREWLIKGWHSKTEIKAESFSEYRIVDKNGKLRWVNGKAVPVKNSDGNITGYMGIILDVTERKEAEGKLKESSEQLRELSRHLQNVREAERMNIAREIHDELGQQLTGLKMDIAWLMKKAGQDDPVIKTKFDDTLLLIDGTVKSIRRIATELRPSIIDDLGLNAAIEWQISEFSERLDVEIEFENNFDDKNVPSDISIGVFRILQESLTNIAKHAGAEKLKIKIEQLDNTLQLIVQDDGIGFDTKAKQTDLSFGLLGIKERTGMMQGECHIFSKPGGGTTIEIKIPLG